MAQADVEKAIKQKYDAKDIRITDNRRFLSGEINTVKLTMQDNQDPLEASRAYQRMMGEDK